jgi:hypothetical protein
MPQPSSAARGGALRDAGRLEEALDEFRTQMAATPDSVVMPYNAANILRLLGRTEEAVALYDQSLARNPHFAPAHHNRALALLQLSRWAEGFAEYEWRRKCPGFADDPRYRLPDPWQGEAIAGKTLYIFPELFQGDLIHFARFALLAERTGARVILGAPRSMHALLSTTSPTLGLADSDGAIPPYDRQVPLLSLPLLFGVKPTKVPVGRYLKADPARVERWRARIGTHGLKVGIVWQGSARVVGRSFALRDAVRALSDVPDLRLISLQKHGGLDQLADCPTVETLGDDFDSGPDAFVDTAAAMTCCDLVITPDTSTAHIAGALGVPTWIALHTPADWRWLERGDRTPWYPTARLFRQQTRGSWAGMFERMAAELRALRPDPPSA